MTDELRYYYVVGPEEETVVPILDDGTGPIEIGRSFWEGFALNAREAKKLAWKQFRKEGARFLGDNYPGHPMRGVKVTVVPPCPNHGYDYESCRPIDCWPVPCSICNEEIPVGGAFSYTKFGDEAHRACVLRPTGEADECDCSLCATGIRDGYGHDDGPADPVEETAAALEAGILDF